MTWAAPAMLWFGLLIPAVLLLWFLKMRRTDLLVSSSLLWSQALEDKRVNSPFQKLKKNLLLLLQLLILALLTLALAGPEILGEKVAGRVHLLLIDVSASMATVESGGVPRLEDARARAIERVENLADTEKAVVITFASTARAVTPVTDDRRMLLAAIEGVELRPGTTRIDEAIELASALAAQNAFVPAGEPVPEGDAPPQGDAVCVIYSDGVFPQYGGEQLPLPIEYIRIGDSSSNSGLTALAARREFSESQEMRILAEIRNPSERAAKGRLVLRLDGQIARAAEDKELAAGERWSHAFSLASDGGEHLLEVEWQTDGTDALALDDRAWLVVSPPKPLRVWLVGPANAMLEDGLSVVPMVTVVRKGVEEVKTAFDRNTVIDQTDIIVWDRVAPAELSAGPAHLFIGIEPPGVWEEPLESIDQPPLVSWNLEHIVNRYIDYSILDGGIVKSLVMPPIATTKALVETGQGALISSFTVGSRRGIVVGFDVLASRFPLSPSFPFFLNNALRWLGERDGAVSSGVGCGELVSFRLDERVEKVLLRRPDGEEETMKTERGGWFRYAKTDLLGTYQVSWQRPGTEGEESLQSSTFAVNLLSAEESDIAPRDALPLTGRVIEEGQELIEVVRKIYWPWLLALALLLLMLEWLVYHRR